MVGYQTRTYKPIGSSIRKSLCDAATQKKTRDCFRLRRWTDFTDGQSNRNIPRNSRESVDCGQNSSQKSKFTQLVYKSFGRRRVKSCLHTWREKTGKKNKNYWTDLFKHFWGEKKKETRPKRRSIPQTNQKWPCDMATLSAVVLDVVRKRSRAHPPHRRHVHFYSFLFASHPKRKKKEIFWQRCTEVGPCCCGSCWFPSSPRNS